MRYIYILITLGINYSALSQTLQFFNLGQTTIPKENGCLVIKNNSKALKKTAELIERYKDVKNLKLVGFNGENSDLDSLVSLVKPLKGLNSLFFEDCDLSFLETSFANFKELESVSFLKQTVFFENVLFPLLKENHIKRLSIQTNDPDIITDSLYLLPELTFLRLNSSNTFDKPNYTQTLQLKTSKGLQRIEMTYYGDLYKANASGVVSMKPTEVKPQPNYQSVYEYIKQPIPGININDTTYTFNPSQNVSFTYQSGTEIKIDRNVFLSENGVPYNGAVTLFYREFRNPVEIMLSGIPMTNKVEGETHLFKSGGMYEINAFDTGNKALTLTNDTAIKLKFALTDTSKTFQFYSLGKTGQWATVSNSINVVTNTSTTTAVPKSVREYYKFLGKIPRIFPDTNAYENRFDDDQYIYIYRKDNFLSVDTTTHPGLIGYKKALRDCSMFRVKYARQTKDKSIVFALVPVSKKTKVPAYISALFNRKYLYEGSLSKEQFKKIYNRKVLFYDVRASVSGDNVSLDLKSFSQHYELSGQIIYLRDDRTYAVQKRAAFSLDQREVRSLKKDNKDFKKNIRSLSRNKLNYGINHNKAVLAYEYVKQFQVGDEQKMTKEEWEKYAATFLQFLNARNFDQNNTLGKALLKSGLGFNNIDEYIHQGQMQNVFVQYNAAQSDSTTREFHTFLYKSINTSYPISDYNADGKMKGYYFKDKPNYIIRFSEDGIMQVTKPEEVAKSKKGNTISLDYAQQYNVKGMDSNAITRLILD
jgi:hypothetical protein